MSKLENQNYYEQGIMPKDLLDENFTDKVELDIPAKGIRITVCSSKPMEGLLSQIKRREIVYDLPASFNENNTIFKEGKHIPPVQVVLLEMMERVGLIGKFSTESKAKLINWLSGTGRRSAEKMFTDIRYYLEHFNNKPSPEILERTFAIVKEMIEEIDSEDETEMSQTHEKLYEKMSKIFVLLSYRKDNLAELKNALIKMSGEIEKEIERVQTKYDLL